MIKYINKKNILDITKLPRNWTSQKYSSSYGEITIIAAQKGAESLIIPLNETGNKDIHIGAFRLTDKYNSFQVRLSNNKYWQRIIPMTTLFNEGGGIQDIVLENCQISSEHHLEIRTEFERGAAICYIALEDAKPSIPTKKTDLGVALDMAEVMGIPRIDNPDDLYANIAPYKDSSFRHIFWGNAAGSYNPLYFSKVLGFQGESKQHFQSKSEHRVKAAHVMKMFKEMNLDPLQQAIEFSHENGLQLWSNDRISKNHSFDSEVDSIGGRFLKQHCDKLVRDQQNNIHAQHCMSFAYPEIRENKIDFLLEQAQMGVDGIFIDFLRKFPIIGFEEKVQEEFKTKHGKYPLDFQKSASYLEFGHAWLSHQSGYVNTFMKDLRKKLDNITTTKRKRIPIGVQVPGDWHRKFGTPNAYLNALDVTTWIQEGWIDFVAPVYLDCLWHHPLSLDRWKKQVEGSSCKIWSSIGQFTRELYPSLGESMFGPVFIDESYISRSIYDAFSQGADGALIWEAEELPCVKQRWNRIKNAGNLDYLSSRFGEAMKSYDGHENLNEIQLKPI